jgi:tRNA 2-thiouridine synthesizing protein A
MTLAEPIAITKTIDARGMACPGPLLALIGAIRQGHAGDVYEVISSDAGSRTDIPAWVAKAKHELAQVVEEPGYARFIVRKTH